MLPLLILPAQVQPPPPPVPPGMDLPADLRVKPGSVEFSNFDQEDFELKPTAQSHGPIRVPVEGRTWRFSLMASEGRVGTLTLLQKIRPALVSEGWLWQWEDRGVAKRQTGTSEAWLKVGPGGSGELKVVVVERGVPRRLHLPRPGPLPEYPKPQEDFPYLPPWPGAKITSSATSQSPVGVELPEKRPAMVLVNFIEKEYDLPEPVSAHEFLRVYTTAFQEAGWEVEGRYRGQLIQIQATYMRDGRDLRATLRLVGDAMAISVADVGAQRPKEPGR